MEKCQRCGCVVRGRKECGCSPQSENKGVRRVTPDMLFNMKVRSVSITMRSPKQQEEAEQWVPPVPEGEFLPKKLPSFRSYSRNWSVNTEDLKDNTENFRSEILKAPLLEDEVKKKKETILSTDLIQCKKDDLKKDESSDDSSGELMISGVQYTEKVEKVVVPENQVGIVEPEIIKKEKQDMVVLKKKKEVESEVKEEIVFGLTYGKQKEEVNDIGVKMNSGIKITDDVKNFMKEKSKEEMKYEVGDVSKWFDGTHRRKGYENRFVFDNKGRSVNVSPIRYKLNDPFESSDDVVYGIYTNSREYPLSMEFKYGSYYNVIVPKIFDYRFSLSSEGRDVTDRLQFGLSFSRPGYNIIQFKVDKKHMFKMKFALRVYFVALDGQEVLFRTMEFVGVRKTIMEKDSLRRNRKRKKDEALKLEGEFERNKRARKDPGPALRMLPGVGPPWVPYQMWYPYWLSSLNEKYKIR
jgi:hypothetical protein